MAAYEHWNPADVKARLDAGAALRLIDVREAEEWAICRIEGAELRPLSQFPALAAELQGNTGPVVLYCHSGMRSQQACEILSTNGVEGLVNMLGGIMGWAETVDPEMPRY